MTNNTPTNHNDQNAEGEGKHRNSGERNSFPFIAPREIESPTPTRHRAELAYTERYFGGRNAPGRNDTGIVKADIVEAEIIDAEVLDVQFDDDTTATTHTEGTRRALHHSAHSPTTPVTAGSDDSGVAVDTPTDTTGADIGVDATDAESESRTADHATTIRGAESTTETGALPEETTDDRRQAAHGFISAASQPHSQISESHGVGTTNTPSNAQDPYSVTRPEADKVADPDAADGVAAPGPVETPAADLRHPMSGFRDQGRDQDDDHDDDSGELADNDDAYGESYGAAAPIREAHHTPLEIQEEARKLVNSINAAASYGGFDTDSSRNDRGDHNDRSDDAAEADRATDDVNDVNDVDDDIQDTAQADSARTGARTAAEAESPASPKSPTTPGVPKVPGVAGGLAPEASTLVNTDAAEPDEPATTNTPSSAGATELVADIDLDTADELTDTEDAEATEEAEDDEVTQVEPTPEATGAEDIPPAEPTHAETTDVDAETETRDTAVAVAGDIAAAEAADNALTETVDKHDDNHDVPEQPDADEPDASDPTALTGPTPHAAAAATLAAPAPHAGGQPPATATTAPTAATPAGTMPTSPTETEETFDWLEDEYTHTSIGGDSLWDSDAGTLSFDSRRALVQLLQGPLVRAEQHPPLWKAILSDEAALRQRLADMFLDLVVDEDAGIAFTRIANSGNPIRVGKERYVDMPHVLRVKTLTIIDTVVLLDLRTRLGLAVPGERVIVDQEELRENASQFRALDDRDEATFNRRFDASLDRMRRDYSLLGDTETEGRYEVSPALKHIFDAQTVAGIKAEFEELLAREESK